MCLTCPVISFSFCETPNGELRKYPASPKTKSRIRRQWLDVVIADCVWWTQIVGCPRRNGARFIFLQRYKRLRVQQTRAAPPQLSGFASCERCAVLARRACPRIANVVVP